MEPPLDWEPPALRLARLRFEVSCLDARLAAERRRERRELDAPLLPRGLPCAWGSPGTSNRIQISGKPVTTARPRALQRITLA